MFVHAYAVASPLSVALLRLVGSAIALMLCVPLIRRARRLAVGPVVASRRLGVLRGRHEHDVLPRDRPIPLAIAVAVSFTGPIVVAAWHSRTRRHALGVVCVALGVLALVHPGFSGVDPVGLALALGNASMWAL